MLCSECRNHFQSVREYLELLEIPYVLNPCLVRGLDYYTKTAFEIMVPKLAQSHWWWCYDQLILECGGLICWVLLCLGLERFYYGKSGVKFLFSGQVKFCC